MERTRRLGPALPFSDSVKKFPKVASHAKGGATLMGGAMGIVVLMGDSL